MSFTVRDTCRLCDAKLPDERVLDLGETPLANALVSADELSHSFANESRGVKRICPCGATCNYDFTGQPEGPCPRAEPEEFTAPLYLVQCTQCGHVQLPVIVDPKLLFPADYPYASSTGAAMREHLKQMAGDLTRIKIEDGPLTAVPLAVEIGSNDGFLLEQLRACRWRTIGIDPALTLATSATEHGDLTVPAFFNRATAHAVRNACGQADLIVANNVMAHCDDLHEIVEGVKVLLAPEGRFVFEVGYLPDVLRANNWPTVYHEHLSYHSLQTLDKFLRPHGLYLFDAHRIDTQGGSVRCFARRGDVPHDYRSFQSPDDRLLRLMNEEFTACDTTGWQSRVDRSAQELGWKLRNVQDLVLGACKTVAGYGASAKSTTLLHMVERQMNPDAPLDIRKTISFICDANPLKQGRYSPGFHIPIVHPDELERRQPDYCVSLSGNFSEAFRKRHPGFKGEWVEPNLGGGA